MTAQRPFGADFDLVQSLAHRHRIKQLMATMPVRRTLADRQHPQLGPRGASPRKWLSLERC